MQWRIFYITGVWWAWVMGHSSFWMELKKPPKYRQNTKNATAHLANTTHAALLTRHIRPLQTLHNAHILRKMIYEDISCRGFGVWSWFWTNFGTTSFTVLTPLVVEFSKMDLKNQGSIRDDEYNHEEFGIWSWWKGIGQKLKSGRIRNFSWKSTIEVWWENVDFGNEAQETKLTTTEQRYWSLDMGDTVWIGLRTTWCIRISHWD